jgi:hypothetical protein
MATGDEEQRAEYGPRRLCRHHYQEPAIKNASRDGLMAFADRRAYPLLMYHVRVYLRDTRQYGYIAGEMAGVQSVQLF